MNTDTLTRVRWRLAPLLAAAGNPSVAQLARQAGVATRTVLRWQHRGLTDTQADRAAIALGLHSATGVPVGGIDRRLNADVTV